MRATALRVVVLCLVAVATSCTSAPMPTPTTPATTTIVPTTSTVVVSPEPTSELPCARPDGVIDGRAAAVSFGGTSLDFMFESVGPCDASTGGGIVADGRGLVSPPGTVQAGATVTITALRYPGADVTVLWNTEAEAAEAESSAEEVDEGVWTTTVPVAPGPYVVFVRFDWSDGDATWARAVTVESS